MGPDTDLVLVQFLLPWEFPPSNSPLDLLKGVVATDLSRIPPEKAWKPPLKIVPRCVQVRPKATLQSLLERGFMPTTGTWNPHISRSGNKWTRALCRFERERLAGEPKCSKFAAEVNEWSFAIAHVIRHAEAENEFEPHDTITFAELNNGPARMEIILGSFGRYSVRPIVQS